MARINIEDGLESNEAFWKLLNIIKNRDQCIGMLVRFFRLAQHRYGYDQPLTKTDLETHGLLQMIESGWAILQEDGSYAAAQAAEHFDWYRQKVIAGRKGGRNRESNKNIDLPKAKRDSANLNHVSANPLAPAPALAPALVKEEYILGESSSPTKLALLWNEHSGMLRKIKNPEKLRDDRLRRANQAMKHFSEQDLVTAIRKMANSLFCQGKKNKPGPHENWQADFDFFLSKGRIEQALEGRFDDKRQSVIVQTKLPEAG